MPARGIELACEARGGGDLSGRDRRRWLYLLNATLDGFMRGLPAESAVHVDLACVASTREHRWLQAHIAATLPGGAPLMLNPPGTATESAALSLLVVTALRLLDGAYDHTHTEAGPVLRLVIPIEG